MQEFKFVDQNDRSREAATAFQSVVRSHVMTQIRQRKGSKSSGKQQLCRAQNSYQIEHIGRSSGAKENKIGTAPTDTVHSSDIVLPRRISNEVWGSTKHRPTQSYGENERITDLNDEIGSSSFFHGLEDSGVGTSLLPSRWAKHPSEKTNVEAAHARTFSRRSDLLGSPSILGKSRVDPFQTLPITADQDVHFLVDHYTVAIPRLMYGTRTRNPVQHHLYHVAIQDAAAFSAMLAYSARQLDSMKGHNVSKHALKYTVQTLRLVHSQIIDPLSQCEDDLVMAVALLAFAERRFGDDSVARKHWLALRQILQVRGGMEKMHIDRWLAATLCWNCLVWSGTFDPDAATNIGWPSLIATDDPSTESLTDEEFANFIVDLANMKSRLLNHINSGCGQACKYSCSRRKSVFALNGPLYKLVNPKSNAKSEENELPAANPQRTASICQLPCLLYINLVTLDYEGNPHLLEHYLGRLMICIYEESLDMDVSAEHLLIQLLIGLEDSRIECIRRSHQVMRLAGAIWRLGIEPRSRIHTALLETLLYPAI